MCNVGRLRRAGVLCVCVRIVVWLGGIRLQFLGNLSMQNAVHFRASTHTGLAGLQGCTERQLLRLFSIGRSMQISSLFSLLLRSLVLLGFLRAH